MTGRELYRAYVKYNHELNDVGVDAWEELPETDKVVWDAMAENLPDCPNA